MITNIVLENFKCFRKVEVNPRLITVFVGPNGTGKSSVVQALALLKQSLGTNGLTLKGRLLNLERSRDLAHGLQETPTTMDIGFAGFETFRDSGDLGFDGNVDFDYRGRFSGTTLVSDSGKLTFGFEGEQFTINVKSTDSFPKRVPFGPYEGHLQYARAVAELVTVADWRGTPAIGLQRGLQNIVAAPKTMLESARFVNAVRGLVQYRYSIGDRIVEDLLFAGGLSQQEQQTATNLSYSRPLESKISGLLQKVTGVGLSTPNVPSRAVEVRALAPIGEVNMVTEGFGANALLLLFWQLVDALNGATVMIEEPEIHLHPKAQAELASLLAEVAKAESKQLIMTTHSEHIVGRLLTLVAEKKLSADDLAIYAFDKDDDGVCHAKELEVTDDGRVEGGLRDFFEADLGELERYIRALEPAE